MRMGCLTDGIIELATLSHSSLLIPSCLFCIASIDEVWIKRFYWVIKEAVLPPCIALWKCLRGAGKEHQLHAIISRWIWHDWQRIIFTGMPGMEQHIPRRRRLSKHNTYQIRESRMTIKWMVKSHFGYILVKNIIFLWKQHK